MYAIIVTLVLLIGLNSSMFGQERPDTTKRGSKSGGLYNIQDTTKKYPSPMDTTRMGTRKNQWPMDTTRVGTKKTTQDPLHRRDSNKKWMNAPVDTSMGNLKGATKSRLP